MFLPNNEHHHKLLNLTHGRQLCYGIKQFRASNIFVKNDFAILVDSMNTEVIFREIDTALRKFRHGASSNSVDHLSVA